MPKEIKIINACDALDLIFSDLFKRGELSSDATASAAFRIGMVVGIAAVTGYEDDGDGYDITVDLMFLAMALSIACNIPPCVAYASLENILQEVRDGYKARDLANDLTEMIKSIKGQDGTNSLEQ